MSFFAVWRNRVRGGGSWLELSADYASRAEAETITPELCGVPQLNLRKCVIEASTQAEARALYEQWEDRRR